MEPAPLPIRVRVFLGLVVAAALTAVVVLLPRASTDTPGWLALLVLLPLVALAQLASVRTPRGYSIILSGAGLVAIAMLVQPELAVLAGISPLAHRLRRQPWRQVVFNVADETLAVTAASAAAHAVLAGPGGGRFALAGLVATLAFAAVNNGLVVGILAVHRGVPRARLRTFSVEVVLPEAMLAALGVVVAWLWLTNVSLVPFAVVALALVSRALHVPQLEEEARLDPKTGLANTRHFHEVFQHELARAARYRRPLAVIVADLDHFRDVNNTYGHLAGDEVLQGIADVFRERVRDMDTAARFGGEEFCVLLPETRGRDAVEVAERIREAVERHEFEAEGARFHVTLSLGVAAFPEDGPTTTELLRRADEALYRAKAQGRNCVRAAGLALVQSGA